MASKVHTSILFEMHERKERLHGSFMYNTSFVGYVHGRGGLNYSSVRARAAAAVTTASSFNVVYNQSRTK